MIRWAHRQTKKEVVMTRANRLVRAVVLVLAVLTFSLPAAAQEETSVPKDVLAINTFLLELWNEGRTDRVEEFLAPDVVVHLLDGRPDREGPEGYTQWVMEIRAMIPDFTVTIDEQIAQGDLVAVMWTVTGTHTGEVPGIPPTGNEVESHGLTMIRVADGKIAEWWHSEDMLSVFIQLGVIPPLEGMG
jgi:steroid delta-isomerase-like uncharacterized protein